MTNVGNKIKRVRLKELHFVMIIVAIAHLCQAPCR